MKMTIKKKRGKDSWEIPYSYAGKLSHIHISKMADGRYFIYQGAYSKIADSFDEALKIAEHWAKQG